MTARDEIETDGPAAGNGGRTAGNDAPTRARRILVDGTYNLRDIGGYPAAEGRSTRWGKLYRSDALHRVSDEGREKIRRLGIRTVVDLRSDDEVRSAPNALRGLELTTMRRPIFAGSLAAILTPDATLESTYAVVLAESGPALADAVAGIAASGVDPVLVHCTAGKDRTGLVVALTLLAVGVDRHSVVEDYALTADNLRGEWAEHTHEVVRSFGVDVTPALAELISDSPAAAIESALRRVEESHGTVLDYLRANGLSEDSIARLRATLLA